MTLLGNRRSFSDTLQSHACSHCGLPVPKTRLVSGPEPHFCCAGCEAVWNILHECHLDDYYLLRDELGDERPSPARVSGKSFEYLDDPEYLKRFAEPRAGGAVWVELYLDGVHCAACSWLVDKVLLKRAGVRYAQLHLGRSVVEIIFSPQEVALSQLAQALDRVGYAPHPLIQNSDSALRRQETKRLLARMGIAGACAANIMLLAASQYAGDVSGIEAGYSALFRWISFGLALPAITYSAWPFYRGAWNGLRQRMLHMDLPISLGILAALGVSVAATILNRRDVYYDSVCALVFLLLAGRLVLQRAGFWAASAGENLLSLAPKTARRVEPDRVSEVLLSEVAPGDRLQVFPGETVPVDGVIESEQAWVAESHLTGEPGATARVRGDSIFAGSTVEQAPVELTATAVGETTRLWGLAQMMRDASVRRAPITLLMDRIAGYFVAAVLILAVVTAVIWLFIDPSRAVWNAAALMVVSCPCALGLATPVALAVAMGRAARRGIYVRGQDGIERIASVRHVILDKTGTLTEGRMKLADRSMIGMTRADEHINVWAVVAALEQRSGHAIGHAFSDWNSWPGEIKNYRYAPGGGIEATADGHSWVIGSRAFVFERTKAVWDWLLDQAKTSGDEGRSQVWVARDGEVIMLLTLRDRLHPQSAAAVRDLRGSGLTMEVLSGDHPGAVEWVARELHLTNFHGNVTPEAKLAAVEAYENAGLRVAMVGDGVNDAAALSRATVGISVAGSAEVARDAADVFISTARGPDAITELFRFARHSMCRIRLNLGIAVGYNLIGAGLAITGHVSPLVAAILMPISSLTVLFIATRR